MLLVKSGKDNSAGPHFNLIQTKATWLAILVAKPAFYYFISGETI